MILPAPGNAQKALGIAFAFKAAARQKPHGGFVARQAGSLNAVQPQRAEAMGHGGTHRLGHVTLAGKGFADPIAEACGVGVAAPDVDEAQAAHERPVMAAENEIAIGFVVPRQIATPAHPGAKRRRGEFRFAPARLPGLKKGA